MIGRILRIFLILFILVSVIGLLFSRDRRSFRAWVEMLARALLLGSVIFLLSYFGMRMANIPMNIL